MVKACIVYNCKSTWSPRCEVIFHNFPANSKRRKQWLEAVPIKSSFYKHAVICSLHFKQCDYSLTSPCRLLATACPSQSIQSSTEVQDPNLSNDKKESSLLRELLEANPNGRHVDYLTEASKSSTVPTTSVLNPTAAETEGQTHKIYSSSDIQIWNKGGQPTTDQKDAFDEQPSWYASADQQKDNNKFIVPVDDKNLVMKIEYDADDTMDDVNSTFDTAENPDCNGDRKPYFPQEHDGFCCKVCRGKIVGFRYRCCECEDYDMCSDCESRGEHPLHYVLRVPGYRKQRKLPRQTQSRWGTRTSPSPPPTSPLPPLRCRG